MHNTMHVGCQIDCVGDGLSKVVHDIKSWSTTTTIVLQTDIWDFKIFRFPCGNSFCRKTTAAEKVFVYVRRSSAMCTIRRAEEYGRFEFQNDIFVARITGREVWSLVARITKTVT